MQNATLAIDGGETPGHLIRVLLLAQWLLSGPTGQTVVAEAEQQRLDDDLNAWQHRAQRNRRRCRWRTEIHIAILRQLP